jgi:hypothetical protein
MPDEDLLPSFIHLTNKSSLIHGELNITPESKIAPDYIRFFGLDENNLQVNILILINGKEYHGHIRKFQINNKKIGNKKRSSEIYRIRNGAKIEFKLKSQKKTLNAIRELTRNLFNIELRFDHLGSNRFSLRQNSDVLHEERKQKVKEIEKVIFNYKAKKFLEIHPQRNTEFNIYEMHYIGDLTASSFYYLLNKNIINQSDILENIDQLEIFIKDEILSSIEKTWSSWEKYIKKSSKSGIINKKSSISFDTSVEDCDFSARTLNCLSKANIKSLGELEKISEDDLLNIENFGKRSLYEVRDILELIEDSYMNSNIDWPICDETDLRKSHKFYTTLFRRLGNEKALKIVQLLVSYKDCSHGFAYPSEYLFQDNLTEYSITKRILFNDEIKKNFDDICYVMEYLNTLCGNDSLVNIFTLENNKLYNSYLGYDSMIYCDDAEILKLGLKEVRDKEINNQKKLIDKSQIEILLKRLDGLPLELIGREYGVTRERIRQIEKKTLIKVARSGESFYILNRSKRTIDLCWNYNLIQKERLLNYVLEKPNPLSLEGVINYAENKWFQDTVALLNQGNSASCNFISLKEYVNQFGLPNADSDILPIASQLYDNFLLVDYLRNNYDDFTSNFAEFINKNKTEQYLRDIAGDDAFIDKNNFLKIILNVFLIDYLEVNNYLDKSIDNLRRYLLDKRTILEKIFLNKSISKNIKIEMTVGDLNLPDKYNNIYSFDKSNNVKLKDWDGWLCGEEREFKNSLVFLYMEEGFDKIFNLNKLEETLYSEIKENYLKLKKEVEINLLISLYKKINSLNIPPLSIINDIVIPTFNSEILNSTLFKSQDYDENFFIENLFHLDLFFKHNRKMILQAHDLKLFMKYNNDEPPKSKRPGINKRNTTYNDSKEDKLARKLSYWREDNAKNEILSKIKIHSEEMPRGNDSIRTHIIKNEYKGNTLEELCLLKNKYSNFGIHEDKDWPEYFNYSTKPLRYLFNLNEFDFSEISPDVYETFKELADLNIEWDKRDKIRERKAEKNLVQLENFLLLNRRKPRGFIKEEKKMANFISSTLQLFRERGLVEDRYNKIQILFKKYLD